MNLYIIIILPNLFLIDKNKKKKKIKNLKKNYYKCIKYYYYKNITK